MTERELRKLSRIDLLQLLLKEIKDNEKLRKERKVLQEALDNKEIRIQEAGSIAEAALQLNGIFEAAEQAAAQYLENMRNLTEEQLK